MPVLTPLENRLEEIILQHTRLAKEYANMPANGGNTVEEAEQINKRKSEIVAEIENLRKERFELIGR